MGDNMTVETTPPPGHNRLALEKSPYLLQHARNPVDWYPWGDEAFERARREDRPIFLSIGYSTCHWCHVMERESFEDEGVARLMNEAFVCVKVDREERPDVDAVYMSACQAMTGSGGWPLTIIMAPDRRPFFAATYIPRTSLFGRMGMLELIPRIRELWNTDRQRALRIADQIAGALRRAPADAAALQMVETTLQAMRRGGIYDQIGFGFHRYSTDARWLVPHFEKMLYDQALLAMAYVEAYQATGKAEYRRTVEEVFAYVLRDMTAPEGVFYSAEDADSEGVEGKLYLWSEGEIRQVLSADEADLVTRVFGVRKEGNFA